eukprot:7264568-Alexandrium_andersonii.AAC.1
MLCHSTRASAIEARVEHAIPEPRATPGVARLLRDVRFHDVQLQVHYPDYMPAQAVDGRGRLLRIP